MNTSFSVEWTVDGTKQRFFELRSLAGNTMVGESPLLSEPFCDVSGHTERGPWSLRVHLSDPFLNAIKKNRKTVMPLLGKALLNLRFGYEPEVANSPGGRDGIFHVNRDFHPKNHMVLKLYDRFLDTAEGKQALERHFGDAGDLQGVRVVSHGMRLLGFVRRRPNSERAFVLVLVDIDFNTR